MIFHRMQIFKEKKEETKKFLPVKITHNKLCQYFADWYYKGSLLNTDKHSLFVPTNEGRNHWIDNTHHW